jgi:multisite-specific tRNA:(cytosine-C5)-methyltransferase
MLKGTHFPGFSFNFSLDPEEPPTKKPKVDVKFGVNAMKESKNDSIGKEEPFVYLPQDHPDITNICKFFNMSPSFPTTDLFVRNATGEPLRAIYITSPLVQAVLERNPSIRLLNAGIRLFVRQPDPKSGAECLWRVHSDGLSLIDPFMGDRVVTANVDEIWELLRTGSQFPLLRDLKPGLQEQVTRLTSGGFVIRVDPSKSDVTDMKIPFSMPMWKSPNSVKYTTYPPPSDNFLTFSVMIQKMDKRALALRIFGKDTEDDKVVDGE